MSVRTTFAWEQQKSPNRRHHTVDDDLDIKVNVDLDTDNVGPTVVL